MNREEKILQEYILYVQHKENFVNRSFATNKFYLIMTLVVLAILVPVIFIPFPFGIVLAMLFAIIGMLLCILWQMNIASYKKLLKVKLHNVIEKVEEELPVQPYKMESQALRESKQTRGIMFADIQTALAIMILITFATIFINELVLILNQPF